MPSINFTYCNECPYAIEMVDKLFCFHGDKSFIGPSRENIDPPDWCPIDPKHCESCGVNHLKSEDMPICEADEDVDDSEESSLSEKPWKPEEF